MTLQTEQDVVERLESGKMVESIDHMSEKYLASAVLCSPRFPFISPPVFVDRPAGWVPVDRYGKAYRQTLG